MSLFWVLTVVVSCELCVADTVQSRLSERDQHVEQKKTTSQSDRRDLRRQVLPVIVMYTVYQKK